MGAKVIYLCSCGCICRNTTAKGNLKHVGLAAAAAASKYTMRKASLIDANIECWNV